MTSSQNAQGGNQQDPSDRAPVWLRTLARAVAPPTAEDKPALIRLVRRLTRAQKLIVGLGSLGIAVAVLVATPPLPWPLSMLQRGLAAVLNLDGGRADLSGAYALAVILQGLVVVGGSVLLWIAMSWRLGKFPPLTLFGFLAASVGFLLVANRSPTATLWAWIVIAALAIAYIYYYRKGRFGYTRGATAAVFSHLALIVFFVAFPLVLIEVLDSGTANVAAGTAIEDTGQQADADAGQGAASSDCSIMEMTSRGCPDDVAPSEESASEVAISLDDADYPPYDVRRLTGGVEVATDATSPRQLRALFDLQRAMADPSVPAEFRGGGRAGDFEEMARALAAGLQRDLGSSQSYEVRIRCASVPAIPGVDPVLATGAFATSDEAAEQAGLASTDEVLFELSDRRDCTPPPLPPEAVTPEEVLAAIERTGVEVTRPQPSAVGGFTGAREVYGAAVGLPPCYAFGCLRQMRTDQLMITVWPTPEDAQSVIGTDAVGGVAGGAAAVEGGLGPLAWLGVFLHLQNPFKGPAVQFGQHTTVHLSGNQRAHGEAIGCQDQHYEACVEAYMDRVRAAATGFEQAAPR